MSESLRKRKDAKAKRSSERINTSGTKLPLVLGCLIGCMKIIQYTIRKPGTKPGELRNNLLDILLRIDTNKVSNY